MNIYVGNLSFDTAEDDLRQAFAAHGEVSSVNIIVDKFSGRSRGFGFVEMPDKGQAEAAIAALNDSELQGMTLRVSEARPRTDRGDRRGGGGGQRRGGGGYRGGGGRSW
jgi:cold-inducible RNA-binding protein